MRTGSIAGHRRGGEEAAEPCMHAAKHWSAAAAAVGGFVAEEQPCCSPIF